MEVLFLLLFFGFIIFLIIGAACGILAKSRTRLLFQHIANLEANLKNLQSSLQEIKQPVKSQPGSQDTETEQAGNDDSINLVPVPTIVDVTPPPDIVPPIVEPPHHADVTLAVSEEIAPPRPSQMLPESLDRSDREETRVTETREEEQPTVHPQMESIEEMRVPIRDQHEPESNAESIAEPELDSFPTDRSPSKEERVEDGEMDLETRIGAVWFNRIGLVGLIIGFALLGRMIRFEPWHKVAGSYLTSAALLAIGWWFEDRLQRFARPVAAGGLALAFFTSFAAHFLQPMACVGIGSSLTLMSLSVGAIFYFTERWQSQSTAMLAIFLGHVAAYIAGGKADSFSLVAILFLCLASLILFLRHNWVPLNLFSVFAAYFTHVLWALRDHAPTTPEASFQINFLFFSSYYFIFLCADLVYQYRVRKWGQEAFTFAQRNAGRSLGPVSVILYATFATGLFYTTNVYWDRIYLFLMPLAFIQGGLLYFHQSRSNPDHPFYASTAIVFFTLGLFSLCQGLSLNMALAAEALILLILSRRLQFWYLNPLAQVVLMVNFLHFWLSGASRFMSWPTYLGCTMTALVYFVKSRLEETWQVESVSEKDAVESTWAITLRRINEKAMTPFSYLHGIGGAILIVYQSIHFFAAPWEATTLALFILAGTLAVFLLNSRALIPATWFMVFALSLHWIIRVLSQSFLPGWRDETHLYGWIVIQSIPVFIPICAYFCFSFAQRWNRPALHLMGIGLLLLALPMIYISYRPLHPEYLYFPIWTVAPLAFWYFSTRLERMKNRDDWDWDGSFWGECEKIVLHSLGKFAVFFAILGAIVTNHVFFTMIGTLTLPAILLSAIALAVLAVVLYFDLSFLLPGLVILVFLYNQGHVEAFIEGALLGTGYGTCWISGSIVLIAGILLSVQEWKKQIRYGICSLVLIPMVFESIFVILANIEIPFAPYPLWVGICVGVWIYEEKLRSVFLNENGKSIVWEETPALVWIKQNTNTLSHVLSLITAFLLFMVTGHRGLEEHTLWLTLAYIILLGIASFLRRSAALASGIPLLIVLSHILYYHKMTPVAGANQHPYLTLALAIFPIAFAGILERAIYRSKQTISELMRMNGITGIGIFHGMGFILYGVFSLIREANLVGYTSLVFPLLLVFPFLVFLIGGWSKQGFLLLAPYCYSIGWLLPYLMIVPFFTPVYRSDLFTAGVLISIQLVIMERTLSWLKQQSVTVLSKESIEFMRRLMVVVISITMLYVLTNSDLLRGYWTTFGWSLLAFVEVALGFLWKDKSYRRTALAIFSLSILRIVFVDVAQLEAFYRMIAFLCLGACLIAVSYLYSRFARDIRRWL